MREFSNDMLASLAYELPDEVLKYRMCGDFSKAEAAADRWLHRPVAQGLKDRLVLEKEMLRHLREDFPYTQEQVLTLFREILPDFKAADLMRLDQEGLAEWIFLDGEKHYIHNIVRNVTAKDDEIMQRAGLPSVKPEKKLLYETVKKMQEVGSASGRFRLRASIRLTDDVFRPGMKLKAHLPIPAAQFQISDVVLHAHSSGKVTVDPEDSPFRSICFEDTLTDNHEFFVEYSYTVKNVYHDFSDEDRKSAQRSFVPDPEADQYLAEQEPHIRFSPYLRALAAEIVGRETDPLAKARSIYDYITTKVRYSFMREYFLIPDIPQYCARNLRGDCGVQALLFITLCRICGIPARWQSGLYAAPGDVGPHDWAQFYVEPYGWLFADPSFGGSAFHDKDEMRRNFYFGNLDPFRMVANNAFQQPFANAKHFLPIDPYDNQSGEIESEERGFGRFEVVTTKELLAAGNGKDLLEKR